jgi:sulfite exporter TauE/SafE
MSVFLTQGFLLGLAMGTTCLATCGPIYAPFLLQRQRGIGGSVRALLGLFAGRFVTYAAFGIVAGFIGAKATILHRPMFRSSAYIIAAALLIVSTVININFEKRCVVSRWSRFIYNPFMLGAITGINFCPSFLVALTKAITLAGALAGMLFFVSFFIGTSIYMLPLSLFGVVANKKIFRTIGRVASIIVAIWLILSAVSVIVLSNRAS